MSSFGSILHRHRTNAGLSQQAVADLIGISKTTYHNWESDKTDMKVSFLPKLAEVFGVDLSDLFPPDLTVTINHPKAADNGITLDARKLYDDLVGSQKRTIQTLEAENRRLWEEVDGLKK
jgi:transcriptional regulator with XRE-family HTH domain